MKYNSDEEYARECCPYLFTKNDYGEDDNYYGSASAKNNYDEDEDDYYYGSALGHKSLMWTKEDKEIIKKQKKRDKKIKNQKESEEKIKLIANKSDENNMIGDFYTIESNKKHSTINLNHILCIFPVQYYDGRIMYEVCFDGSENVDVDYAEALELAKLTKERLAWYYPKSRDLFGIKISNITQIYKVDDEYHIEMSRLKYRYHSADKFKTFLRVDESIGKFIIKRLQVNGK